MAQIRKHIGSFVQRFMAQLMELQRVVGQDLMLYISRLWL
jgi:hypothetical protein